MNAHSQYCIIDNLAENKARFKDALKEALRTHWYKLKDLYDSIAAVYPEAAENISFRSIRSYMKRCRRSVYPPQPDSIREFVERLIDRQFARNLEYATGRLTVELITDDGGNNHALFFDHNFVENEMQDVSKLFVDGTFRSTPGIEDAQQLVTVIGIRFNHGIPFIWIVMSRKTQAAYSAVFAYIREHVIPNNRITLVRTDFERGLRNAISQIFPDVHVTGCNTHHDRALYQKAKSLGLRNLLRHDKDANNFFKKIMGLAYLPAHLVREQFTRLQNELNGNTKRRMSGFLQYYKRYWLQTVKPEGFSVYGLARRTNNIIESYNSRLGHKLQPHPSPWDFVCKDIGNILRLRAFSVSSRPIYLQF